MDYDFLLIVSGLVIYSCTKMWIKHRERSIELHAISRPMASQASADGFATLQAEVSRLRDTTTQYDLSVERNMQEIMQRLQVLEAKTAPLHKFETPAALSFPSLRPSECAPTPAVALQTQPEVAPQPLQLGG